MALDYNLKHVPDSAKWVEVTDPNEVAYLRANNGTGGLFPRPYFEDESGVFVMNHATQALIFMTLRVGMRAITDDNNMEFWRRTRLYEQTFGATFETDGGPVYLSQEDVFAHIGLTTNAPTMSKQAFGRAIKKFKKELDRAPF